jgi:hypothetical protein
VSVPRGILFGSAASADRPGFEVGAKPVDETVVEAVQSLRIDDLGAGAAD